jgi:hypothetical protein
MRQGPAELGTFRVPSTEITLDRCLLLVIKRDGPKRASLETGHTGGALFGIYMGNAQLRISNNSIEYARFRTGGLLLALSAYGGGE